MIRDLLCILVMCPVEAFGQKGLSLFNHHSSQPQSLVRPKSMHVEQVSTGETHILEYLEVWRSWQVEIIKIVLEQEVSLSKSMSNSSAMDS